MVDIENYLYEKILPIIKTWDEKNIYAISFFVHSNEAFTYKNYSNVFEFAISYNTEEDCNSVSSLSEERWNFAFWRQDMCYIITPNDEDDGIKKLFEWYKEKGIENIGLKNSNADYDEKYQYIGKGPIGYWELLNSVSNVARRLQQEGIILKQFGKIPIIVHDLEYSWYVAKLTDNANPNNEATTFLKYLIAK